MIINVPRGRKQKPSTNSRNFTLDPYYDTLRKEALQQAMLQGPAPAPRQVVAAPAADQSLALVERLFALLSPILTAALTQGKQTNPGMEMVQNYAALNQVLKEQTLETARMYREMVNNDNDLPEEGDDMPEPAAQGAGQGSMVDQLLPFLVEIGKKLLVGGPEAAGAAALLKAAPQFKQIVGNPGDFKEVLKYLDKQNGPDKTNIMLKTLKVHRPK